MWVRVNKSDTRKAKGGHKRPKVAKIVPKWTKEVDQNGLKRAKVSQKEHSIKIRLKSKKTKWTKVGSLLKVANRKWVQVDKSGHFISTFSS